MTRALRWPVAALLAGALTLPAAGCAADAPDGDITAGELDQDPAQGPTTGPAADRATVLLATSAGSCTANRDTVSDSEVELVIANDGDTATTVEVRDVDGDVLAEQADVDPGTSSDLDVDLLPGDYRIACLPEGADELVVALRVAGGGESPSPSPASS